ncbi:MAG: type II toxin-antitoxin system Phd/YefM family antitoxin [Erysipelotrichaceae bacterium]|nr:type II toxin-antitoxin system Phd/YefM family antitoxin [Erysipelotrichaceae bacterium]
MTQVNMLEAKTNLTKLIKLLETKQEDEILIARNGEPVAKITKYEKPINKRIGIAAGKHKPLDLDLFNSLNDEITTEFYGE